MRRICTVILLSLLTTSTLFAHEANSRDQSKAQLIERVTSRRDQRAKVNLMVERRSPTDVSIVFKIGA